MPKPKTAPSKNPAFLDDARAFYADAFEHRRKKDLAESMDDWAEMTEDEQTFTAAHLAYLNLQAQASNNKLLTQVRDLLDELAEALTLAVEASIEDERADEPEDEEPTDAEEMPLMMPPDPAGVDEPLPPEPGDAVAP
jgi:hypothetical protein